LRKRNVKDGVVVINMSTSRVSEDVARAAGCRIERTAVGEVNVAERMEELQASFGGEGNGGVIDPLIHYGRDAIVGMGLILEYLADCDKTIGQLAAALPKWHMIKSKLDAPVAQSREVIRHLKLNPGQARVNTEDGLRLDWEDRWVHLRASNTEPVLRIIAEARSESAAKALIEEYTQIVKNLVKG
jgi:phosphomannomutase